MLLEIDNLDCNYGRIRALHGVSLSVEDGELVALVGANGAGKTTLLRCISGVQPASGGAIRFAGDDITAMAPERRVRRGIAQAPEHRQVFGPLSVTDNLLLGGYTRSRAEIAEDVDKAFAMFPDLKQRRRQAAGTLSGGQQQMLAISRALMARPRLLLLDEPSMGLAPALVAEVFDAITALRDAGVTILLVEQNAFAALSVAKRGYVIEAGRISLSDTGAALLENDAVKSAYLGI
jgi:branched-chain amino acid transport system ATP-binding protein